MKTNKITALIKLQLLVFVYSLTSVLTKLTSVYLREDGLFALPTLAGFCGVGTALLVYAFFWQRILEKVNLTTAYAGKATELMWTLLWAVLLFREPVGLRNVAGMMVICAGVFLVTNNE